MLELDGAQGEGGGQVLRTALSLALLTGQPFRLTNVRARRDRPGLRPQHVAAVRAAAQVGQAQTLGVEAGSGQLEFRPGALRGGEHRFDVGTAGSAPLVLQTVLLPLAAAGLGAVVTVTGGTHNPKAPSADFLADAFLPQLRRAGATVTLEVARRGFVPTGGGELRATLAEGARLRPFDVLDAGAPGDFDAQAIVAHLPRHVGERELAVVQRGLRWPATALHLVEDSAARGPGNAVVLTVRAEHVTEVVTAVGARGVRAEAVATEAVRELRHFQAAGAPVGPHLADQLLLVLAPGGGGAFESSAPSLHARTQADVIARFLPVEVALTERAGGRWRFTVKPRRQVV